MMLRWRLDHHKTSIVLRHDLISWQRIGSKPIMRLANLHLLRVVIRRKISRRKVVAMRPTSSLVRRIVQPRILLHGHRGRLRLRKLRSSLLIVHGDVILIKMRLRALTTLRVASHVQASALRFDPRGRLIDE